MGRPVPRARRVQPADQRRLDPLVALDAAILLLRASGGEDDEAGAPQGLEWETVRLAARMVEHSREAVCPTTSA